MTLSYYSVGRAARGSGRAAAPSAGGNSLSHRPDAVPGYTGYTPASMCVPPQVHTKLTERDPSAPLPHRSPKSPAAAGGGSGAGNDGGSSGCNRPKMPTSSYTAAYPYPEGVDFSKDPRVKRPAAITAPSATPPSPELAHFPRSTYQMELLQRSSADINGPSSRAGEGASCSGASTSAPASPAQRVGSAGWRPGYLTTAAAATAPVAERFAAKAAAGAAAPRDAVGTRPADSSPCAGRPRAASAALICGGSGAAACFRDPQMPAAPRLSTAGAAATAGSSPSSRLSKDAAYLHALDQHSRGRLPGYTGHRRQHNAELELPPPTKLTTWGADSQEALRRPLPPPDTNYGIKSGLLGFFSVGAGSEFVSENGLADAARFHETTRPMEGLMKIPQPSRTTRYGAKFTA